MGDRRAEQGEDAVAGGLYTPWQNLAGGFLKPQFTQGVWKAVPLDAKFRGRLIFRFSDSAFPPRPP